MVTIVATNQPPTSVSLSIETTQNTASEAALPVVEDVDDNAFSYEVMQSPGSGVVQQLAAGFVYTPVSNFLGSDSFIIRATDSEGQSVTGVATVEVTELVAEPEPEPETKPKKKKKSGSIGLGFSSLMVLLIALRRRKHQG
jgi:hypothetical protein